MVFPCVWALLNSQFPTKSPTPVLDVTFQIENILVGHGSIVAEHHTPSSEYPPQRLAG